MPSYAEQPAATRPTSDDDEILREARKRWVRCADAEEEQRKRIVAAKQFRALNQWPDAIKTAREGGNAIAGQPPQPPRPCLVVDRLSQPVRQVSNTIKNADFGFDVQPNGEGADIETADIFKGYLRRVQNQSRGESPIEWAADGAIEGGIGWFRLRTEYVYTNWEKDTLTEELFDQELRMERIANNLTVYGDPSATRPTRSDMLFAFVTEDLDRDEAESRYDAIDLKSIDLFAATGDMQGWADERENTVRIAEYWRVTFKERKFVWMKDGSLLEGEAPKGAQVRMRRTMRVPQVEGFKMTATQVLERWDWAGSRIPLIPVIGEELNIDGKPLLRGIIELGMDAQRMVNYAYSGAIEIFALGSKKAPMVPGAAVQNYRQIWQTRNIYNHSYLPYDVWDEDGRQLPPPTLDTSEAPIQAAVEVMRVSEDAIKASTSTGDASLGNTNPNERSGKALQALQAQSDLANSNYPDNVRRALIYAAELMVEIIPKITRPGQIVHIMGMDDEPQQVIAGQPFQPPQAKGQPPTPRPDVSVDVAKDPQTLFKFYDFNAGKYAVTVTVGKATATRQQEGAQALGELIPHLPPEMAAVATPDYVRQLSFPGAQKIAERLEKALPPALQPQQDGQQVPDPQQLQQQVQQLQQQLQQAAQAIQTDQVKAQAGLQQAQIKADADLKMAQFEAQKELKLQEMKNANAIAVARIAAAKSALDIQAESQEERLSTGIELQHEAQQNALDRAHEAGMSAMSGAQAQQSQGSQQAHEATQAAQGQAATDAQAEAQRQHEAQLAAQQQAAQGRQE